MTTEMLTQVAEDIAALTAIKWDNEVVHLRADEYLLQALRLLGPEGAAVAQAYEDLAEEVDFWYA